MCFRSIFAIFLRKSQEIARSKIARSKMTRNNVARSNVKFGKTTKEVKNSGNSKPIDTPLFLIASFAFLGKVWQSKSSSLRENPQGFSWQSTTPRHCEQMR